MFINEIFLLIILKLSNSREVKTINGTVITLNKLIIAVKEIDKDFGWAKGF